MKRYVFLTAGACGPCRFGMYATEYRKALRDAGFEGFRVMLFQQTGGLKQATGEEAGLAMNPAFFMGLVKALIAGDVINGMGYRLRPFEVEAGATDRAIEKAKRFVHDALVEQASRCWRRCCAGGASSRRSKLDWTRPAPRVSIIGEFWAMTTEGDGNYQLQRFLESEGAECDIQFVTNWLLFMLWEGRYDTKLRAELRGLDKTRAQGIEGREDRQEAGGAVRGRPGHPGRLPDCSAPPSAIAATTCRTWTRSPRPRTSYYDNSVRGGEGHMEVGKFILNVLHKKIAHDAVGEAVRLHAVIGRVGRHPEHDHGAVPGEHLLRDRDLRRRQGQRAEPRADVPVQGASGWRSASTPRTWRAWGLKADEVRAFLQATRGWPAACTGRPTRRRERRRTVWRRLRR